jgi:hypothetical protein
MQRADAYGVANVNVEFVKIHSEVNSILANHQLYTEHRYQTYVYVVLFFD